MAAAVAIDNGPCSGQDMVEGQKETQNLENPRNQPLTPISIWQRPINDDPPPQVVGKYGNLRDNYFFKIVEHFSIFLNI